MSQESIEQVITRALNHTSSSPAAADVLRLYLELPRIILRPNKAVPGTNVPFKVRSSFEAAYTDAEAATAAGIVWLGAIAYLCFLDEVGTALRRTDKVATANSSVERSLELFSNVDPNSGAALYALRCALAHDYSLVNIPRSPSKQRQLALRHAFQLHDGGRSLLVEFPATPWDGDFLKVEETLVDIAKLRDVARGVHAEVYRLHRQGLVALALDGAETRRRYFFVHPVDAADWNRQEVADARAAGQVVGG
jgi:hypothetical protein